MCFSDDVPDTKNVDIKDEANKLGQRSEGQALSFMHAQKRNKTLSFQDAFRGKTDKIGG